MLQYTRPIDDDGGQARHSQAAVAAPANRKLTTIHHTSPLKMSLACCTSASGFPQMLHPPCHGERGAGSGRFRGDGLCGHCTSDGMHDWDKKLVIRSLSVVTATSVRENALLGACLAIGKMGVARTKPRAEGRSLGEKAPKCDHAHSSTVAIPMSAQNIHGEAIPAQIRAAVSHRIQRCCRPGMPAPGLVTPLIDNHSALCVHMRNKPIPCGKLGFQSFRDELPDAAPGQNSPSR
jgi:hypothetical protein